MTDPSKLVYNHLSSRPTLADNALIEDDLYGLEMDVVVDAGDELEFPPDSCPEPEPFASM